MLDGPRAQERLSAVGLRTFQAPRNLSLYAGAKSRRHFRCLAALTAPHCRESEDRAGLTRSVKCLRQRAREQEHRVLLPGIPILPGAVKRKISNLKSTI